MITLLLNLIKSPRLLGVLLFFGSLAITWAISGSVPDEIKNNNSVKTEITHKFLDNGNVGKLTTNSGEYIFRRDGYVTSTTGQGDYEKYSYFVAPALHVGIGTWIGTRTMLPDAGIVVSPGSLFFGYVRPEVAIGRKSAGIGVEAVPFPDRLPGLGLGLLYVSAYSEFAPEIAPVVSYQLRF